MTGERNDDRPLEAADAAAQWFVRLQDEAATGEDWLAFEGWLAASPAHAAAYERLEGIWVDLDDAAEVSPNAPVSLDAHRAARARPALSRRGWLVGGGAALAASLAIAVVGVSTWPQATTETYATAAGETRQITLADGTKVRLNAASKLEVRLERHARRVEMADGEAVLDVTHDPKRPFLIDTGDRQIRVVGTEFNVRQRGDDFALTVRRGVVEVRPAGAPNATATRVPAGQRLTHRRGAAQALLTAEAPDAAFAWTQGQLVYSGAPLSDVAADLSRSLGTPVAIADAATGQLRFSGVLGLDDKDAVLRRLEAFAPVRAERTPQRIVLHRR